MKLKSEQDIIDIIDYLKSTSYVFLTYLTYCQDRIDAGLPLSDYVIDQMVDYLDGIIDAGDSYYLIDYIQGKIDAVDFLNNEEKESYKEKYESAVSSSFMTACTVLRYRLTNYRGQWTGKNETEIIHYGNVCDGYYQYKLCSVLGITSMDLDSYGDELYSWYSSVYEYYTDIVNRASELSEEDQERLVSIIGNKDSFLDYSSAEDLIELLLESSSSLVYELEYKPNISIKYTDETVQEYVSYIAYYLLSPYDEKFSENESITLNESQTGSFLNLCFTLAHEGYPGHLYAHVLAKQNDLSALVELYSTLGSSEGWAQYAAYTVLLSYAATQEDEIISLAIEYVCVSTFLDYISSSFFDYLVNYRGYTSTYLQNNYGFSKTEAEETIEFYSGDPCTIASYGYGLAMQLQFHSSVKSTLGEDYSEQEYNQYLLTHYANFGLIKLNEATEKYILEKANQQ